jgi:HK97 family phage prohead protease
MTTSMLYRAFTPDLEVRSGDGTGRTVYGIAVPYNAPTRINAHLTEVFVRGAFAHQVGRPGRVKFAREHMPLGGELIGAATLLREDTHGLYGEFRIAATPKGNETLELIRAGALDELSIGFIEVPGQNRKMGNGLVERHRADLREVAVVMEGAYGQLAAAAGVRSAQAPDGSTVDIPHMGGAIEQEFYEEMRAAQEILAQGLPPIPYPDLDERLKAISLGLMN